jgi:hypothetical protein
MARKVRNASLDTRAARSKLTARGKPYYFALDPGLHLGYRKLRGGAGTWVMRRYVGEQNYETRVIATADDLSDANGIDVLDFWQAQTRARELRDGHSRSSSGKGPYTVRQALADYWSFLRGEGRPAALVDENERRANALIVPELGELEVASLTAYAASRVNRKNIVRSTRKIQRRCAPGVQASIDNGPHCGPPSTMPSPKAWYSATLNGVASNRSVASTAAAREFSNSPKLNAWSTHAMMSFAHSSRPLF